MSAPYQSTPWTDARCIFRDYDNTAIKHELGADVDAEDCRSLERHLRHLLEAAENHGCDRGLRDAINKAKEFLK